MARTFRRGGILMNQLQAGFARANITPMLGIDVKGYYEIRKAQAILDELEVNVLALRCCDKTVILLSIDNCGIRQNLSKQLRQFVAQTVGLCVEAVHIHATHTHTGPVTELNTGDDLVEEYITFLKRRLADAAVAALEDLKPARMGIGTGIAPNIAFVRRFRMKDGSIRTNPGVNNPDIEAPVGEVDEQVHVVRFDRENADSLVLINFGNHPDTVGGCNISCDWPGFARRTVEKALEDVKCIFFNGAQGDVNHVNVHPKDGELNDMFMDFDDVSRGYGHARYMGRVVAGAVLQVYDKVAYRDVEKIDYASTVVSVPSNMPEPDQLPMARRIDELHRTGRDQELPYKGMMLTTVVAEARRMLNLEHGPESFEMEMSAISVGDVAILSIPGEPFTELGKCVKKAESWRLVMPFALTDGFDGYFPTMDAYEQGGYEARSSPFKAGVAELLVEKGLQLLSELRKKQEES